MNKQTSAFFVFSPERERERERERGRERDSERERERERERESISVHFEGTLPSYLSGVLCTYHPSRSLRSSNERLLKVPERALKTVGERSFSFLVSVWNSLPFSVRNQSSLAQFKSALKTYLFNRAFV